MTDPTHIVVRNARVHNLQGVDVAVPRHALVVFTGVSGSGKSSLVFDTIHKEGQRRFMESLSAYARQFLGQMERPEVDAVEGLSPTVCIDQKTVNRNPRSTVGTVTEIHDHLRLLMARLGEPRCPICDHPIHRLGTTQIVDRLLQACADRPILVLGPVVQERKGEHRGELEQLARDGWVRVRVDGVVQRVEEVGELDRYKIHTIEVVVDRIVPTEGARGRLVEAVERALALGAGTARVLDGDEVLAFSTSRACPTHPDQSIPELEPRLFSFNAPQGACPTCQGLGRLEAFDPARFLDPSRPIGEAFLPFNAEGRLGFSRLDRDGLIAVARGLGAPLRAPVASWSDAQRRALMHGDPAVTWSSRVRGPWDGGGEQPWPGLLGVLDKAWSFARMPHLEALRSSAPCPGCAGARLNPIARSVVFRGRRIHELGAMGVREAASFFADVRLDGSEAEIGELLLAEIRERLGFLVEVGLDYLTLSRSAATLSGGEAQRIRLASQVGSGLQGVTYVLDEPSIGLHPRDNARLLGAIRRLVERGNSVLVVEHDAETIAAADHLVEIGPGAGREGGRVLAEGPPGRVLAGDTLTARWMRGQERYPAPPRRPLPEAALEVRGARLHNLRGVDLRVPLGRLTAITGVSGSGKSTLIFQVLEASVASMLDGGPPVACASVEGLGAIGKLVRISQRPIGRTPRSNPATYTGAMDLVRDLFASLPESAARGYPKGRFSFNVAGGRCEACEGAGVRTIEMQFLPDVEVPCEACGGRRFNAETLEVRWAGRNIADVLELPVREALALFERHPKLRRILQTLVDVGLDYVTLGQPSTTLSGGEAQRVKLATELAKMPTSPRGRAAGARALYLLDEPTTGLHFEDVRKLLGALHALVEAGHTVVVVEHHTDVVRFADHVVDLGPDGGDGGGQVMGEGAPEAIARMDTPTGRALAAAMALGHALAAEGAEPAPLRAAPDRLRVVGARKHNLRGVDVDIKHGSFTVVTGPSGSGKTSLAFDTLFAEGQRRYVESLSTYARRFLGRLERAPVDRLEGLQPAIAVDQTHASHNPRSTVATVTEIHDVLRVLYARVGTPHCPRCDRALRSTSPSAAALGLAAAEPGAGWLVARLTPTKGDPAAARDAWVGQGWTRLLDRRRGPVQVELADPEALACLARGAFLVVDRFDPNRVERSRIAEAVQRAYALGDGTALFVPQRAGPGAVDGGAVSFTSGLVCLEHGPVVEALTPRHFSFNSRQGMCEACEGLGVVSRSVPERLLVGDGPVRQAIDPRLRALLDRSGQLGAVLDAFVAAVGRAPSDPLSTWPRDALAALLDGSPAALDVTWSRPAPAPGLAPRTRRDLLRWPGLLALAADKTAAIPWITSQVPCPTCGGARLAAGPRRVRLAGRTLHELSRRTVAQAWDEVRAWDLGVEGDLVAQRPRFELERRLRFLVDVGLGYLTLDRPAGTLSGGESQRIRLASQLGSGLCGVTYVLDEPTIGLHPRDTARLVDTLLGLRDAGNTVVVVEHDPDTIARADDVIDMGPAAGTFGGRVVAQGSPAQLRADPASPTGRWLSGREAIPARAERRAPTGSVRLWGARAHNLRGDACEIGLGVWTAVTGVSGSGKSTLILDTLAPALAVHAGGEGLPLRYDRLEVDGRVDGVVIVDQRPIGTTPRSTPATYVGVMDKIRALYAQTPLAQERGWGPGRFSFNAAGGRCEACEGRGAQLIEMHFLPDVWIVCPVCRGRRYEPETLGARFKGLSIADLLDLRVDEALDVLAHQRALARGLQALVDVGLGYIKLGHPGNTFSGGEAQRIKLAAELVARSGRRVYVLDEPTTGLHLSDVARLVGVLHRLVDAGHTVITIEHHLDMIRQADAVLELGPDGGAGGGRVLGRWTPEALAAQDTATGAALRGST